MKNGDWRINRSPSLLPAARKALHYRLREAIFAALGNICCRCGFSDVRALQIDHVHGGGTQEFKKKKGTSYLYHVLKNLANGNYQLLCANCNWIKRFENKRERGGYVKG
jgi:RNase P subunit RPR2